jgi:hypothetical protein
LEIVDRRHPGKHVLLAKSQRIKRDCRVH